MKWIKCSEQLPEIKQRVLVCNVYDVYIAYISKDGKCWKQDDSLRTLAHINDFKEDDEVIYWMPLPENIAEGSYTGPHSCSNHKEK